MSSTQPLVSVIMPVYNNDQYVRNAIESVLAQTYNNFEFIIIDDCSTDDSFSVIESYAKRDKRIKSYRNLSNKKVVETRNKGFLLTNPESKYYAIMDSDDVCEHERLQQQVSFLERMPEHGVVGSNLTLIDEGSNIIGQREYPSSDYKIRQTMLLKNCIANPAVMIRADVIRVIGAYNLKYDNGRVYDRARDYDLWMRVLSEYKIANIKKPLLKYRISNTQGKTTHLKETIRSTMEVQRKWLFTKQYFSVRALIQYMLEYGLLIMPDKIVLWLFKKLEFKK